MDNLARLRDDFLMKNSLTIANISLGKFFIEVKDELKKVIWPSKQETIRLTTIVIVACILVGLFIGGLDFMFTNIFSLFFKYK